MLGMLYIHSDHKQQHNKHEKHLLKLATELTMQATTGNCNKNNQAITSYNDNKTLILFQ